MKSARESAGGGPSCSMVAMRNRVHRRLNRFRQCRGLNVIRQRSSGISVIGTSKTETGLRGTKNISYGGVLSNVASIGHGSTVKSFSPNFTGGELEIDTMLDCATGRGAADQPRARAHTAPTRRISSTLRGAVAHNPIRYRGRCYDRR